MLIAIEISLDGTGCVSMDNPLTVVNTKAPSVSGRRSFVLVQVSAALPGGIYTRIYDLVRTELLRIVVYRIGSAAAAELARLFLNYAPFPANLDCAPGGRAAI